MSWRIPLAISLALMGCAPTELGGGGGGRFLCGDNVCEGAQVCCGCGFCAAPGQGCPEVSCDEDDAWIDDPSMPPPPCTERADCPASHYCEQEGCGEVGSCAPRPTGCVADGSVCGCDGRTHPSACHAAAAGSSVGGASCATLGCEPMDATGEGLCGAFFGWAFDGNACEPVTGCACTGTQCELTFGEQVDCEAAYGDCAP